MNELQKKIDSAYVEAMRAKDGLLLDTFRMLKSAVKNKAIDLRKPELDDNEIIAIIKSEVKKRKESIELYIQGGRPELAEKEAKEISVLEKYLPTQSSREDIAVAVKQAIDALPEESRRDFGRVMGSAMKLLKGAADGGLVGEVVREILAA